MNRKLVLDDLPKLRIEDSLVLARVGFALVNNVAPIEPESGRELRGRTVYRRPAVRRLLHGACSQWAHNGLTTMRSSTLVTPGARQATRSASSRSIQERTFPLSMTSPPLVSTVI